jgi:hypothetical protein
MIERFFLCLFRSNDQKHTRIKSSFRECFGAVGGVNDFGFPRFSFDKFQ